MQLLSSHSLERNEVDDEKLLEKLWKVAAWDDVLQTLYDGKSS